MALNIPAGVSSNATVRVTFVPDGGVANPAAPTVSELEAGTDISCHLMADGFNPGAEEATTDGRRLCSPQSYEIVGAIKFTIDDLVYVYDVQNPGSDTNAAYEALEPNTTGYLFVRWGLDVEEAWAAGQVVDGYEVRLSQRRKQQPEADNELKVAQKPSVLQRVAEDYALTA